MKNKTAHCMKVLSQSTSLKNNIMKTEILDKAIRRNMKIDSLHRIRSNNDRVLKSCPTLAIILIRTYGWSREVATRYATNDYSSITLRKMYNKIRK